MKKKKNNLHPAVMKDQELIKDQLDGGLPEARSDTMKAYAQEMAFFRNTVLKYDDPLEPVGLDDWEVLQK